MFLKDVLQCYGFIWYVYAIIVYHVVYVMISLPRQQNGVKIVTWGVTLPANQLASSVLYLNNNQPIIVVKH